MLKTSNKFVKILSILDNYFCFLLNVTIDIIMHCTKISPFRQWFFVRFKNISCLADFLIFLDANKKKNQFLFFSTTNLSIVLNCKNKTLHYIRYSTDLKYYIKNIIVQ